MPNNLELFQECLEKTVSYIDPFVHETLNKKIIPEEITKQSKLLEKNEKLINLLEEYKKFNAFGDSSHNEIIIENIDKCLKYEGMNLSPFSQYLMVHDLTYDIYLKKLSYEEKELIIKYYLRERHDLYQKYNYNPMTFQVVSDNYSHKRKASVGVDKIKSTCEVNNIMHYDKNKNQDVFYLLPDNGDKQTFLNLLKEYNLQFAFASTHQDKMPDGFIKYHDKYFIIEHKKMKSLGGGQYKQITEIIDFISNQEDNVHYISYLDGPLFNALKNPPSRQKLYKAKQDIQKYLTSNRNNYFLSEYGFNILIESLVPTKELIEV